MFRKKTKRIEVKVEAELNNPPAVYVNDSEHAAADAIISVDHPPQSDTTTDKLLVEYGDCSGEQKNRFTPWLPRPVTETAMVPKMLKRVTGSGNLVRQNTDLVLLFSAAL